MGKQQLTYQKNRGRKLYSIVNENYIKYAYKMINMTKYCIQIFADFLTFFVLIFF